ncbi:RNA-binding protein 27-like [Anguilla anguilla]|uniref:RNA-binding protein 27-like n=1 Tax=Anguilla anguilla TaxID=7936 RepID=UPI0015AE72B3|nr:RNA-binding protein 27-like [Anguilla anguilla]
MPRSVAAANVAPRTEPNVSVAHEDGSRWSGEQESRKWPLGANQGPLPKKPWMDTLILNNQHKLTMQKKSHYGNTKLEVCKIPRDLNNITKLNEHFSAFGTIVNIQVAFGGDPEAALIRYASTGEARRAVSSTEAVLKNRFIQVRWHRDGREQEPRAPQGQSYSAPTGPPHASVHKTTTASVYLQKTAYSSSIMKSTPKTVGKVARAFEAQKAMKKKQEALKLQQDMTRVKQRMLEKQIECQKVLINRLERTRAVGPQERAQIVRTLKELSEKIGRLKEAVRSASVSTAGSAGPSREMPTQKELLGAELDVQKKLISGEDSTDLKKKLGQLQVEAARLGLVPAGGKVSSTQDRGRGRGRGVGGRGGGRHLVVDHRPQTPTVLGVTNEEEKELRPHFVKFGDIEEVQEHNTAMTFRTQGDMEIGENQGEKFKGQTLQITCYTPEVASEPMNPKEDTSKEEPVSSVLLPDEDDEGEDDDDDDEDEEDEHESRSWRR